MADEEENGPFHYLAQRHLTKPPPEEEEGTLLEERRAMEAYDRQQRLQEPEQREAAYEAGGSESSEYDVPAGRAALEAFGLFPRATSEEEGCEAASGDWID